MRPTPSPTGGPNPTPASGKSAASAAAYYKSTLLGDPVEVTGTRINLSSADGELFDWAYTWPQWSIMAVKSN